MVISVHESLNPGHRENYTQSVTDRTRKRDILVKKKDLLRSFSLLLPSGQKAPEHGWTQSEANKKIILWWNQEEIDGGLPFCKGWLRSRLDLRQNSDEQSLTSQVDFGWALWETQKAVAFPQKAKNYLLDVCWTEAETSRPTASYVASQISSLRDDIG